MVLAELERRSPTLAFEGVTVELAQRRAMHAATSELLAGHVPIVRVLPCGEEDA